MESRLDIALKKRIKAISNVFEVGTATNDYAYIENLDDGRGFTATQYGLVSNELEFGQVIALHARHVPNSELVAFLPYLPPLGSGTDMVHLSGLPNVWRREARAYPSLIEACEIVADELYYKPAVQAATEMGLTSAVAQAIFYDTILQHGGGDDPDSFGAILQRTIAMTGRPASDQQEIFLRAFLNIRRLTLRDPVNIDTTEVWRRSVHRINALETLLTTNPALSSPIMVEGKEIRVALN